MILVGRQIKMSDKVIEMKEEAQRQWNETRYDSKAKRQGIRRPLGTALSYRGKRCASYAVQRAMPNASTKRVKG